MGVRERIAAALLATLIPACGSPGDNRVGVVGGVGPPQQARGSWVRGLSAAGGWRVRWRSAPSPIPVNEPFRLVVEVENALDGRASLERVTLAVDAGMPSHGHGMLRVPRVVRDEDGRFTAEGMLFHMPGPWELYLDVEQEGVAERAQFSVEVD